MFSQKPSSLFTPRITLTLHSLVHERPLLLAMASPLMLFSMGASACKLRVAATQHILDRAIWFVLPAGVRAAVSADLSPAQLLTLEVHESLRERVVGTYRHIGLSDERLADWLATPQVLPLTVWVHELCHRYLFERHLCGAAGNIATDFLETELLKEFYYLCRDREGRIERAAAVHRYSPVVERALSMLEANLVAPLAVDELARRCRVSESTLSRAFKRELKCTPGAYARARRMDEALAMLRAGCFSITEVASRVGYDSPTSFSHAFQLRFGHLPSSLLRRHPAARSCAPADLAQARPPTAR